MADFNRLAGAFGAGVVSDLASRHIAAETVPMAGPLAASAILVLGYFGIGSRLVGGGIAEGAMHGAAGYLGGQATSLLAGMTGPKVRRIPAYTPAYNPIQPVQQTAEFTI